MKVKISSRGNLNKRVLLIGPFPPPYGGVSVHLSRLVSLLKDNFSFELIDESPIKKSDIFNLRELRFLSYLKRVKRAKILYIHSGKTILQLSHLIVGKVFFKKTIITLHGFTSRPPKFIFIFLGILYRLANVIIVVNEDIRTQLKLPLKNCIQREAFIPPCIANEPELPDSIKEAVTKSRSEKKTIICANAFKLKTFQNQDIYGLDLCIEVTKRLRDKGKSFTFIFVVTSTDENDLMYKKYQGVINSSNLSHTFFLLNTNLSFVRLIQKSDIVVRPTNTDGDSLSIREGIFLNKRVLTSDVVLRPPGSILFQNRNVDDFELKLEKLIDEVSSPNLNKTTIDEGRTTDRLKEYRTFYSTLLNKL